MTSYLRYQKEIRTVQDADDIESWITVRGNHIPIKKGQSKEEAVKSFLKNKGGSSSKTESSKKWSGAWSKRANKPTTLGEAAKKATEISKKRAEKKWGEGWKKKSDKESKSQSKLQQWLEKKPDINVEKLKKGNVEEWNKYLKWRDTSPSPKEADKHEDKMFGSKNAYYSAWNKYDANMAKNVNQEAGYTILEMAYNMNFGKNAAKNKAALLKEIRESGENQIINESGDTKAEYMGYIVESMKEKDFEDQESFRKGLKVAKKNILQG